MKDSQIKRPELLILFGSEAQTQGPREGFVQGLSRPSPVHST